LIYNIANKGKIVKRNFGCIKMLSVGIVGLPNVGKSTLFNALMKREVAKVGRHPFTTITPNKGVIAVPDERLDRLVEMFSGSVSGAEEIQRRPATIEFVDIAGLVKGAAEGEGLGNQFLSHIRGVDLILHVLREFDNPQVPHVAGRVDPVADVDTINLELVLADFETVSRGIQEREKKNRSQEQALEELMVLKRIKLVLDKGQPAISAGLSEEEQKLIGSFNLLTLKPVIFILNIAEKHLEEQDYTVQNLPKGVVLPVCIKLAADLYQLKEEERKDYLSYFKARETGLGEIIKRAYQTLGLITFYTVKGGKKISAWSIKKGASAIEAAGAVHTDFARKFVKMETVGWRALIKAGSWQRAKDKGLISLRGRDYQVQDGQVAEFKFSR